MNEIIQQILSWYEADNPASLARLYRTLNTGRLAGTGRMIILPMAQRVKHVVQSAFDGRRIAIFSGGAKTSDQDFCKLAPITKKGGGFGSTMGRNVFQRPKNEALGLIEAVVKVYAV